MELTKTTKYSYYTNKQLINEYLRQYHFEKNIDEMNDIITQLHSNNVPDFYIEKFLPRKIIWLYEDYDDFDENGYNTLYSLRDQIKEKYTV